MVFVSMSFVCAQTTYETLYFHDGRVVRGTLLEVTQNSILFLKSSGDTLSFLKSDVKLISDANDRVVYQSQTNAVVDGDGSEGGNGDKELNVVFQNQTNAVVNGGGINVSNGYMQREGTDLFLNGVKVSESLAMRLFSQDDFSRYKGSFHFTRTGAALSWLGAGLTISGVVFAILYSSNHRLDELGAMSIPFVIAGNVSIISGIVLRSIGKGRLSGLAEKYNSSHLLGYSLSPVVMNYSIGDGATHMGLGASISLNF